MIIGAEILLTGLAWRKGWGPSALVPLGVPAIMASVLDAAGGLPEAIGGGSVDLMFLADLTSVGVLAVMSMRGPGRVAPGGSIALVLALMLAFTTLGCATYGNYRPVVDPYGDANAHNIPRDEYECRQLANQASGGPTTEAAKGAIGGGLLGAAAGAAIGAATGNPGRGAAVGAATGGIGGATYMGLAADQRFKRAFQTCMRNRGHSVLD